MLYPPISAWQEVPDSWPTYGLFPGHESRNGTVVVPLSIKWPFGQVMVLYLIGHAMLYRHGAR